MIVIVTDEDGVVLDSVRVDRDDFDNDVKLNPRCILASLSVGDAE